MKRYALLGLIMWCAADMQARTVVAPVVAASYANGNVLSAGKPLATSYLPSVKAGIHIEHRITPNFYIQPGVFYSVYGFKVAATSTTGAADYTYTTAELPLYLLIKTGMPCKPRLVLGAGAMGVVMLNSKVSSSGREANLPGKVDLNFGTGLMAGLEMPRGFIISATYQSFKPGSSIVYPYSVQKLRQWSVGIGYLFGKIQRCDRR